VPPARHKVVEEKEIKKRSENKMKERKKEIDVT